MKILTVDDSNTTRAIERRCFQLAGNHQVTEANDFGMAMSELSTGVFDIIFIAWDLSRERGLELLKAIREQNQTIPILMTMREGERRCIVSALEAGMTDYLVMPFTPSQVDQKMSKWAVCPV